MRGGALCAYIRIAHIGGMFIGERGNADLFGVALIFCSRPSFPTIPLSASIFRCVWMIAPWDEDEEIRTIPGVVLCVESLSHNVWSRRGRGGGLYRRPRPGSGGGKSSFVAPIACYDYAVMLITEMCVEGARTCSSAWS